MLEISPKFIDLFKNVNSVVILTGAGVSAESGIETFRDPNGLWSRFNPMELASVNGFLSNPSLVWEWYNYRRNIVNTSKPNPGHYAIAEMQDLFPKFTLITQNVDRLHQSAGSLNVVELHGNIMDNFCNKCKKPYHGETSLDNKQLAYCPDCGGLIRPAVVWFGENLPVDALEYADEVSRNCDVFFSAGTSGEVFPAANLPLTANRNGAVTVEVNPNETAISHYMIYKFKAASGEFFPQFVKLLKESRGIK